MMTAEKSIKVLVIYNNLFHYRVPIFKLLASRCELTVAYSYGPPVVEETNFSILKLPVKRFRRFVVHQYNLLKLGNQFDVVIGYGDIAWLSISSLSFIKNRKFKLVLWTPGVSASYSKKYDSITFWDSIRDIFYRRADALVFYTDYPIKKYISRGFEKNRLFVAPNTVKVAPLHNDAVVQKDSILFVGTLYMEKGIQTLLENYKYAHSLDNNLLPLNIIGGGEEFETVRDWISSNNLESKIFLHGAIFDVVSKSHYFKRAYACISPVQAGLSVLESMGYGVPFVTMHDAITGGERLNIIDGINGILLNDLLDLKDIILDINENGDKYIQLGKNALDYYNSTHTPQHMADGLYEAVSFVANQGDQK